KLPPFLAYIRSTGIEALEPHPLFQARYYIDSNLDLSRQAAKVQPLQHYYFDGAFEGRNPQPHFDSAFYLNRLPHLREQRKNPLEDYVLSSSNLIWAFHPLFDVKCNRGSEWSITPAAQPHLGGGFAAKMKVPLTQWDVAFDTL